MPWWLVAFPGCVIELKAAFILYGKFSNKKRIRELMVFLYDIHAILFDCFVWVISVTIQSTSIYYFMFQQQFVSCFIYHTTFVHIYLLPLPKHSWDRALVILVILITLVILQVMQPFALFFFISLLLSTFLFCFSLSELSYLSCIIHF